MLNENNKKPVLHCVGGAWGLGAMDNACAEGPRHLRDKKILEALSNVSVKWADIITLNQLPHRDIVPIIREANIRLSNMVSHLLRDKQTFVTLGGDQSVSMGTWNGVLETLKSEQKFGLLWVDAHMDSHTFETTESQLIHGMPLAALLGYGHEDFLKLNSHQRVLDPRRVCILGVRSYEKGEAELLEKLKVRVFKMDEIHKRGLSTVFKEAMAIVKGDNDPYGITIDLDAFDPSQTPAVTTPEIDGLDLDEFCRLMTSFQRDPLRIGTEIVEYSPAYDKEARTEKAIVKLLEALF